jgi:hypothetical protein
MSASNAFETDILLLVFNNTDIANIGDAAGLQNSVAAGSLYVALHTADPGEAGNQSTSETTYTGYARLDGFRQHSFQCRYCDLRHKHCRQPDYHTFQCRL